MLFFTYSMEGGNLPFVPSSVSPFSFSSTNWRCSTAWLSPLAKMVGPPPDWNPSNANEKSPIDFQSPLTRSGSFGSSFSSVTICHALWSAATLLKGAIDRSWLSVPELWTKPPASEERRVGKECRSRALLDEQNKKDT